MKFPKTPDELKQEIEILAIQTGDLRIRQLINILHKVDDEIIVEGVFQTIEDESNQYVIQNCAGRILKELNPRPNKESKNYLIRILKNWDKSCEEIPFWMSEHFGLEHLKLVISEIEKDEISEVESDQLKTIKWWLKI